MKKFFSLIALVGVFAACQPEQIQTAFKVAGAKLTVNVSVVDLDGTEYADATITSTAGTVSGKTITFEAAENTEIPAQTITVSASTPKLPKTYSQSVSVPQILAGGNANIDVRMVIGEKLDDYTFELVPGDPKEALEEVLFLDNPHYPTYGHNYTHNEVEIENWYVNDSEYILSGTVDYSLSFQSEVIAQETFYDGFASIVDAFASVFDGVETEVVDQKYDFKVSAYGMWTAWQKKFAHEQKYDVVGTKGSEKITVGSFTVLAYDTTVVEEIEIPMPLHIVGHDVIDHTINHTVNHTIYIHGHDEHGLPHAYEHTYTHNFTHDYQITYPIYSHYEFGHGVAGGNSNAGGGIVWSE